MHDEQRCGMCGLPIHQNESGVRHFGFYVAHSERRCIDRLRDLNEALGSKVSNLTQQLDNLHGTPCAQIRWQQEREEMRALLDKAFYAMCAARPVSGDDEAFQDVIDEIGLYTSGAHPEPAREEE